MSAQKNEDYKEEVMERFFDLPSKGLPKARAVMVDMEPKV